MWKNSSQNDFASACSDYIKNYFSSNKKYSIFKVFKACELPDVVITLAGKEKETIADLKEKGYAIEED